VSAAPVVTVCDVLDAGACIDGVLEFVRRHLLIACTADQFPRESWIQDVANRYGSGSGDGYGYGDG